MNRREFLKKLALSPVAWAVGLEVAADVIREEGQRVVEGCAEGVCGDISGMVISVYDHTDWEKVEWDEMPEGLETIELEWGKSFSIPSFQETKHFYGVPELDRDFKVSPEHRQTLKKLAEIREKRIIVI